MPAQSEAQESPIAVVLSMLTFVPGGMGGSETYARELAARLDGSDTISLQTLVPESASGAISAGHQLVAGGLSVGASTVQRLLGLARARLRSRSIRRMTAGADIIHYPFTVPGVLPANGQRLVMTIHDVQHRELPHLFSALEKLFRVFTYERPARRADAVITISEFAKKGIVRHLRVPEDRITVAPLGVDTSRFVPNLGERDDIVFYPARGWPHKNHRALIDAVGILRQSRPTLRLVLTGGNLENLGQLPEWVENRGLVSVEALHELYRRAAVMAFPSLYEGFGLPPLEAMASGCPVAASNAGSIPEVVGEAAVLFDPEDPASIAAGIAEAMGRKNELASAGLERVASFTWERCAEKHREAYAAAGLRERRQ